MSIQLYRFLHLFSVIMLAAVTFGALAAPLPEHRRRALMWSGIFALIALVTGFGMLARLDLGFPGWVIVKIACWLGLAALPGLAFRRPQQVSTLRLLMEIAVLLAVWMAIFRPF